MKRRACCGSEVFVAAWILPHTPPPPPQKKSTTFTTQNSHPSLEMESKALIECGVAFERARSAIDTVSSLDTRNGMRALVRAQLFEGRPIELFADQSRMYRNVADALFLLEFLLPMLTPPMRAHVLAQYGSWFDEELPVEYLPHIGADEYDGPDWLEGFEFLGATAAPLTEEEHEILDGYAPYVRRIGWHTRHSGHEVRVFVFALLDWELFSRWNPHCEGVEKPEKPTFIDVRDYEACEACVRHIETLVRHLNGNQRMIYYLRTFLKRWLDD